MEPSDLSKLVSSYLEKTFADLKTKNTLKVEELHAGKWWVASPDHWNYRAAAKAVDRRHRLRHFDQLAVRSTTGGRGPQVVAVADAAGRGEQLRRSVGEDRFGPVCPFQEGQSEQESELAFPGGGETKGQRIMIVKMHARTSTTLSTSS